MGRWPGGARQRLQEAALERFAERGFAAVTVDEIAAAAGVSQRTFFRHFGDKEEVLFGADDHLLAVLTEGVRAAPPGATPAAVVTGALLALARTLQPDREALRSRARVLASDVALQGRDLVKQARWTAAIAAELAGRDVEPGQAELLASASAAAFRAVYARWLADPAGPALPERLVRGLDDLAALLPAGQGPHMLPRTLGTRPR